MALHSVQHRVAVVVSSGWTDYNTFALVLLSLLGLKRNAGLEIAIVHHGEWALVHRFTEDYGIPSCRFQVESDDILRYVNEVILFMDEEDDAGVHLNHIAREQKIPLTTVVVDADYIDKESP